jgi:hypothetical protein
MINVGKKLVAHDIQGFLAGQAIFFLLNFNLAERQIWITRHGESTDNLEHRLGGSTFLGITPLTKMRASQTKVENTPKLSPNSSIVFHLFFPH